MTNQTGVTNMLDILFNQDMFLLKKYHSLLHSHPLATKSITGGFICSSGDAIVQQIEKSFAAKRNETQNFNFRRMGIAWVMGNVFMMPLFHYYLTHLLPLAVKRIPIDQSTPLRSALCKVFVDQTVWSCYLLCHYLMIINVLETGSVTKGIEAIKHNFTKGIVRNWQLWPAAQMLNFLFIPRPYQVLWMNFIGLFWNIYLSYLQHN